MRATRSYRRTRRKRRQVAEINVVPYIDVMLVLLVIFMITAPLLRTGVDIDLPDAEAQAIDTSVDTAEPLVLTVDKDGAWYLNIAENPEEPMARGDVLTRATALLRRTPDRRVMVAGDTAANYGEVMQAMVALQQAGAPEIGLVAEPPQ